MASQYRRHSEASLACTPQTPYVMGGSNALLADLFHSFKPSKLLKRLVPDYTVSQPTRPHHESYSILSTLLLSTDCCRSLPLWQHGHAAGSLHFTSVHFSSVHFSSVHFSSVPQLVIIHLIVLHVSVQLLHYYLKTPSLRRATRNQ